MVEFFPGFVTPESDFGRTWGVHHYGIAGHKADKDDDDASVGRSWVRRDPHLGSGELVADLISAVVTGSSGPCR